MKKNPVILSSEQDGRIIHIQFIDGKKYKLQHPGNRTYMEWQQESFDMESGLNTVGFMDNAFEHCVIPDGHDFKPTIDNVKPAELEVWQKLLRRFLRGGITVSASAEKDRCKKSSPDNQP